MQELKERILKECKVLEGNIIKVDGFLNHKLDTQLFARIADEFSQYFNMNEITLILTAEASGIALATICGYKYNIPVLFAKKAKSANLETDNLYTSKIFSYTYKQNTTLLVSKDWLTSADKVLIIDDFMANGYAVQGLVDLVNEAGANLIGIGIAIEKGFQKGGDKFRHSGIPYKALAIVDRIEDGKVIFRDDD